METGHIGSEKLYHYLKSRGKQLQKDECVLFTNNCETCLLNKKNITKNFKNDEINYGNYTFDTIGMDVIGNFQPVVSYQLRDALYLEGLFSDDAEDVVDENERYLNDNNKTMDAAAYWKFHGNKFPELIKIARKSLLASASSAPLERLFSNAKNIEIRKRYHMVEETLSS